jgi:hypothetical protein
MNHIRPGCRPSADYAADPGFLAQIAYSHLQWRLHGMPPEGKTGGVVFVADDLAAWLIGMLADAGRKKLTTLVLGSDQERALRQAAAAAIESTAAELDPSGGERAGQLAMVVNEVFREVFRKPPTGATLAAQATLLEALQARVAERLAVLDDAAVTGTGQSSAEVLGVRVGVLAETLARNLIREIMVRGSGGGPLAPLADQLNHDVTHLQGQRLEGMLAQLADLVMTLARTGSDVASRPVKLLPRPPFLAGRERLLAGVDAQLAGAGADGPRVVALCGLGGAGKTSVALEYAHRHLAEVGVAWQFAAEDAAVLAAGFGELADQLGARILADGPGSVAWVHRVLAASQADWLLVFDNAPDRSSVEAFLPPAGRGRVLITSRNRNWPPGQVMYVPVLDTEVAAAFMVTRTGDADGQAAAGLAAELDGLPLALEQAAAYIRASGGSLVRYLGSFRERRGRLLARGEPTGYSQTVATTWSLAFTQLEQSAPEAVSLLRLLACCAPEPIPIRLLLQPRPGLAHDLSGDVMAALVALLEDDLAVDDAMVALGRFSLVIPAGNELGSVHRLVQAVTLAQVSADVASQWERAAAALVEAAIPADSELPANWRVYAVLLPHARAVLDLTSGGMRRMADYLGQSGNYSAARDLFQLIADAFGEDDAYGPEHLDTLMARANLAYWTGEAGDAAGARDQFAALLPIEERVLGPEHPRTLPDRGGLAIWTGEAGDAVEARDQFATLLPIQERVLGPEHPDTLTTRHNLARWTGEAGDPARARDQLAALLPIQEQVMGAGHPDTLVARGNLARWTGEAGDAAAARDLYVQLVRLREQALGSEHPDTLTTRHEFAYWIGEAGDPAAARDLLAALLRGRERVLGPEHPETLMARHDLTRWIGEAGDPAAARDEYDQVLRVRERVLGPEHPDTLITRSNLARWIGEAGDPAAARDLLAALLPVRERVSGPEHPDTLITRSKLARWTGEAGDPAAARDLLAALLPARERVSGPEHPDTLTICADLAYWTEKVERGPEQSVK